MSPESPARESQAAGIEQMPSAKVLLADFVALERIKERLRPQERLAMTQLLTETRMTFVRKRGL